jgi:ABC-type multidrug transport system fused ATPase/permease subunit
VFFLCVDKLSGIELKRIILKYILISFIIILTFIFTLGYETFSNFISNIVEYQDSRTFLFTELFSDLSKNEVYFGRGSLGSYYSDFFERTRRYYDLNKNEAWAGDVADRITIEVGYLQMILKGGFVMMFFYSALGAYASYVAIFKSNNKFVKRLGFYITIILILSIISLRPAFTPTFIIFWMAIGTVCIKKNRSMNDDEISNLLNKE